ncbi:MAG: haloacid dehalogenase [Symbiobacteriaceae bacterium]|nr:haloacid dehalogenase [Symbiobacteriaceae bacterium]
MIKLLVTDLDGTIVRRDGTISDRVRRAFAACQAAGIHLCVATGRVKMSVTGVGQEFTICHGGTVVMQGNEILHRLSMTREQAARAWHWAAAHNVQAVFFADNRWFANFADESSAALEHFLGAAPGGQPDCEVPLARLRCAPEDLAADFPDLHLEHDGAWTYLRAGAADKGTALQALMDRLGLAPHEVACFGDELNDLPMFLVAGHRVAVANARSGLKAEATRIVPGVEEDGVAEFLEELLAEVQAGQ